MTVRYFVCIAFILNSYLNVRLSPYLCDVDSGCELKSTYDICTVNSNCTVNFKRDHGFITVRGSKVNIQPYEGHFKFMSGKYGKRCDKLFSKLFDVYQLTQFKVQLLHYGRQSNISISIREPITRQYYKIASTTNVSLSWTELSTEFDSEYESFQLIIESCVSDKKSFIALYNANLVQTSDGDEHTRSCSVDQFECGNSSCIRSSDICNFKADCENNFDESPDICGKIPSIYYCNFDTPDWCGWHNIENDEVTEDHINWRRQKGATSTENTGPNQDHTTGNGYYVYMDASDGKFVQSAVLESPVFNRIHSHKCKIRFHYHMFGMYVSALKLKLVPLKRNSVLPCKEKHHLELWSQYKNQGREWKYAEAEVKNISTRFKLHFIAHIGFKNQGDIALDDVSFSSDCYSDNSASLKPINRTVYSFGTCGNIGPFGPTQFMCDAAYKSTQVKVEVISNGTMKGTQVWTVPENGTYRISAAGARGGKGVIDHRVSGGGYVDGKFNLSEGQRIYIIVGQHGTDACSTNTNYDIRSICQNGLPNDDFLQQNSWGGGGGGGATYVFKHNFVKDIYVPLIIAGGGGGQGYKSTSDHEIYRIVDNLNISGANGFTDIYGSGGGGGWNGTALYPQAGRSLLEGATGGLSCNGSTAAPGGFGGGGAACLSGGGGGGYTGGDANTVDDPSIIGNDGTNFYHPTAGDHSVIHSVSVNTDSFVEINFLLNCPCDYWCNISDWEKPTFACLCPEEQVLMTDGYHCEDIHVNLEPKLVEGILDTRYIAVIGVSVSVTVCVLAFIPVCCVKYKKTKQTKTSKNVQLELNSTQINGYTVRTANTNSLLPSTVLNSTRMITEYNPNYDFVVANCPEQKLCEINCDNLRLCRPLGHGAFGEVYRGYLSGMNGIQDEIPVAVKTLPALSTEQTEVDFLMEAVIMSKFDHPNIVKFIGVCFNCHPRYIIIELLEGGDLKTFLRESRPKPMIQKESSSTTLTSSDLMTIAIDIARGCQHLEEKHFIHRDIAARNCLLTCKGPNRTCKIADFGMTKDIYRSDYYKKGGRAMLPIKWMPPEAFLDGVFSSKTDVWSFGVLLWEIFSMGYMPYPGRTNHDVMQYVTSGGRLDAPEQCPQIIYQLMYICWAAIPETRPTFTELIDMLEAAKEVPEVINAKIPTFYQVPKLSFTAPVTVPSVDDESLNRTAIECTSSEPLLLNDNNDDENRANQLNYSINICDNLGSNIYDKSISSDSV